MIVSARVVGDRVVHNVVNTEGPIATRRAFLAETAGRPSRPRPFAAATLLRI